jgi:hypothetical protein
MASIILGGSLYRRWGGASVEVRQLGAKMGHKLDFCDASWISERAKDTKYLVSTCQARGFRKIVPETSRIAAPTQNLRIGIVQVLRGLGLESLKKAVRPLNTGSCRCSFTTMASGEMPLCTMLEGHLRPGSNENLDPPLSAHVLAMQVGVAP